MGEQLPRCCGLGKVLDKVRYQRAQEMLMKSTLRIDRIAEMLGFAETASFSRAFRRWSGLTPSAFRHLED